MKPKPLSSFDRLCLEAISSLIVSSIPLHNSEGFPEAAYGVTIHEYLVSHLHGGWLFWTRWLSYGKMYVSLDRLEDLGLVVSSYIPAAADADRRGGCHKRCFQLTDAGRVALAAMAGPRTHAGRPVRTRTRTTASRIKKGSSFVS